MSTDVASTQYGVITYYDEWNTLELKWLPATKDATEAAARDTMILFAAQTEKLKPQFLIVDTTEFLHRWADDMMTWRDKEIIPRYNAGGPAKFAFITGEGVPFPTVESGADPAPDGPATFPTGWFTSRDRAYHRLAAPARLQGPARPAAKTARYSGICLRPLRDRHPSSPRQKCERPREEKEMPVAYVDIPAGVNDGAKKKIFQELYEEIHQAWPIPDTRVLIREWPNEAVSQDGRIENVPMRPICTLAVPPDLEHDAKQRLVRHISNTIGEACGREVEEIRLPSGTKIYNNWVLTFFWELPLDKVALGDLIAAENPLVLESLPAR